jgi:hypothetical protein
MKKILAVSILVIGFAAMLAAQVSYPYTPASGNPISASGMVSNFSAINTQFTNLDSGNWSAVAGGINYAGGKIGIGASNPPYSLAIGDGTGTALRVAQLNTGTMWGGISLARASAEKWYIGLGDTATYGNKLLFRQNSTSAPMVINDNGQVGIGTTSPSYTLDVSASVGDFAMRVDNTNTTNQSNGILFSTKSSTQNSWYLLFTNATNTPVGGVQLNGGGVIFAATSDQRLKDNIVDTRFSLADLMKVKVRDYNFKTDLGGPKQTGFIAQELVDIFPGAVSVPAKTDEYWSVDYGKLTPLLVKSVQDQQEEIEALKKDNAGLKAENADLKARLAKIEAKLGM